MSASIQQGPVRCSPAIVILAALTWGFSLLTPNATGARPMVNDPEGFQGIPWGSSLQNEDRLTLISTWLHVTEYEFKAGPPQLGQASLESVKLSSVSGKFARVTIRYQGEKIHKEVLGYLEAHFGSIERIPGSMVRGLTQQYNWRGPETEINLTYQAMGERGFIFIESRTLAPRFNDTLPDSAY